MGADEDLVGEVAAEGVAEGVGADIVGGDRPDPRAIARRPGWGSSATTSAAPRAFATWISRSPIEPAPTTATREPAVTPAIRCPRTMHATGSMRVAATSSSSSGITSTSASTFGLGTRMYSASPPGSIRVVRNVSQSVWRPARHRRHSKHGTW